ncbi:MAG: hypothetical protein KDD52_02615 [Bdellovibrionales bacterium]|nr:hypothetical protein [Bdellovibrionales bacterium]
MHQNKPVVEKFEECIDSLHEIYDHIYFHKKNPMDTDLVLKKTIGILENLVIKMKQNVGYKRYDKPGW